MGKGGRQGTTASERHTCTAPLPLPKPSLLPCCRIRARLIPTPNCIRSPDVLIHRSEGLPPALPPPGRKATGGTHDLRQQPPSKRTSIAPPLHTTPHTAACPGRRTCPQLQPKGRQYGKSTSHANTMCLASPHTPTAPPSGISSMASFMKGWGHWSKRHWSQQEKVTLAARNEVRGATSVHEHGSADGVSPGSLAACAPAGARGGAGGGVGWAGNGPHIVGAGGNVLASAPVPSSAPRTFRPGRQCNTAPCTDRACRSAAAQQQRGRELHGVAQCCWPASAAHPPTHRAWLLLPAPRRRAPTAAASPARLAAARAGPLACCCCCCRWSLGGLQGVAGRWALAGPGGGGGVGAMELWSYGAYASVLRICFRTLLCVAGGAAACCRRPLCSISAVACMEVWLPKAWQRGVANERTAATPTPARCRAPHARGVQSPTPADGRRRGRGSSFLGPQLLLDM